MAFRLGVLARTTPLRPELPQQPAGRLRLLHVEDNPADALLAQSYIRGAIPDVEFDRAACLGDVTSESATTASCAILDLSLPDASGLEALQSLRGMSEQLPIVVLTGFDDIQIGLSAIRNGAEDYLLKNFVDADGLQRAIRYAIERRRLRFAQGVQTTAQVAPRPLTAAGTHQVAIRIDPESGSCLLQCQTCSWQAERGYRVTVQLGIPRARDLAPRRLRRSHGHRHHWGRRRPAETSTCRRGHRTWWRRAGSG